MKFRKKIIISSYDDLENPVYSGGGAVSVHEVAKRLTDKYNVTVITGTYKGAVDQIKNRVRYVRTGSDFLGHKIGQIIYQIALIKQAIMLNYDVWIESATPPFTFSLLPFIVRKPLIVWIGMLSGEDMQRKYFLNFRRIERFFARFYTRFIVPTRWVYEQVRAMNDKAVIDLIPCGYAESVMLKKTNKDVSLKSKYLLFIGRVEINQKGLDLLLRAMSNSNKKISLVIAGGGEVSEMNKLIELIKQYKLDERVHLAGRVSGEKKSALLKNASATVISSRFESFSLTALESLSYQTPVVCFSIPQLSWIPNKFSYKAKPYNVKQLSKIFDKIASSRNTKLAKNPVKKYLKDYSWDKISNEIKKLLTSVL